MSAAILQSLYGQKSWTNNELFTALANVAQNEHPVAVQTALRTLNHIYVVDEIFKAHLIGAQHGYATTNTEATPSVEELHMAAAETDAWFEAYVKQLTPESLNESIKFDFTDGDTGSMTREEMLFHVLTHGAYHRGNVGQVLKSISVTPPRDLFTRFLHVREPARRQA
jgi:uncharacterized damage-inducible protein DinB